MQLVVQVQLTAAVCAENALSNLNNRARLTISHTHIYTLQDVDDLKRH